MAKALGVKRPDSTNNKTMSSKSLLLRMLIHFFLIFSAFVQIIMSTKAGESGNRKRPQKHQNKTVWKADKNKSDPKTKLVQSLTVTNCCQRCTEVIEWKIK